MPSNDCYVYANAYMEIKVHWPKTQSKNGHIQFCWPQHSNIFGNIYKECYKLLNIRRIDSNNVNIHYYGMCSRISDSIKTSMSLHKHSKFLIVSLLSYNFLSYACVYFGFIEILSSRIRIETSFQKPGSTCACDTFSAIVFANYHENGFNVMGYGICECFIFQLNESS